ncbi:MAG: tRNA guanosine(34) transglycosylase Tgt [Planctomycetota bacterium]
MSAITYEILKQDTDSNARLGRVTTPHGTFDTPAFMPVGTQGTIKGLLPQTVADTGAQIVLGNTYHLLLRPGSELIARMGGLQDWTGWRGPMLTDSGGFQVFSLGNLNKIDDNGVKFKSHLDGATIDLTPERSMLVQEQLGADIIMAFDDCPPAAVKKVNPRNVADSPVASDATRDAKSETEVMAPDDYARRVEVANERTLRWLDRCVTAHKASGRWDEQGLFGIVQGGTDLDQRTYCAERVTQHDLPGFAVGGVAVGEGSDEIKSVVEHTAPLLPTDKPRYLMGVGYERDIVAAVRAGVDMFDCVLPTRNGRNASAFTSTGLIRLKNAKFADDPRPIEEGCDCEACRGFSRSYIRHLFAANEMLGGILVSLHNLRHFQRLLLDIRVAIRENAWSEMARRWPVAFPDGV